MKHPTLFILCGLPGSGKTTRAKQLERDHFRSRAAALGAASVLVYLEVSRDELVERLLRRNRDLRSGTFPVSEAQLDEYLAVFEAPNEDELLLS